MACRKFYTEQEFSDLLDRYEQYTRIGNNLISLHRYWDEFEIAVDDEQEFEDRAPRLEMAVDMRRSMEMAIETTSNAIDILSAKIICKNDKCSHNN